MNAKGLLCPVDVIDPNPDHPWPKMSESCRKGIQWRRYTPPHQTHTSI